LRREEGNAAFPARDGESRPAHLTAALVILAATVCGCLPAGRDGLARTTPGRLRHGGVLPGSGSRRGEFAGRPGTSLAQSTFDEASDLYLLGDFRGARDVFRRLALGRRGELEAAWAWYWAAMSDLALGYLARACSAFESALACSGGHADRAGDLRAYALAGLADVSLAQGRPAKALEYLHRIGNGGLAGRLAADQLLFRRAAALEGVGKIDAAARAFGRLADLWPDSSLAAEAAARSERLARRAAVSARLSADLVNTGARAGRFYLYSSPLKAAPPARAKVGGGTLRAARPAVRRVPPNRGAARSAGYRVTAGVFWEQQTAEAAASRLRAHGLAARIEVVTAERSSPVGAGLGVARAGASGGRRFAVSLGSFAERADAERLARAAARKGFHARVLP
jgi:tetratricopeptide (TPR) repeat protein